MDQLFGWVAGVVTTSALAAFAFLVWRTRGLRRRLFLTLLAVSLLPAATVGVVTWRETAGLGRLAEAPGLRDAVDASVELARALLLEYETDLAARAAEMAASVDDPPVTTPDWLGWVLVEDSRTVRVGGSATTHAEVLGTLQGAGRLETPALIFHRVDLGPGSGLVVVRVLDPALVRRLEAAGQGAAGLRQLGLYYEEILRGRALLVAAAVLLLSVLLAVLVSTGLTNRLVRPLADLVRATRRVADGDREFAVATGGVDEVRDLEIAFNDMTAQLVLGEAKLRRSERLAAWQGIARRLAHEIKNPLTPIHLAVHRARQRVTDSVVVDSLVAIEEETRNLQRLAEEFSALGRLPAPRRRPVQLDVVAREVGALYLSGPVSLEVRGEGLLDADEGQLRQVLSNLFKNASEAMGGRGRITLAIEASSGVVGFDVEDDGPGLPADPEQLFEPEFTTRSSGTGLGLAIVRRIIEDHQGSIRAVAGATGGARFCIQWPSPSGETADE